MNNFVTEDDICDWVYKSGGILYTRKYNNIHNTDLSKLPDFTLVCLTGYPNIVNRFFSIFAKKFTKKFILITLETDVCNFDLNNVNNQLLYHWFTWNKTIEHEKVTAIPIGLNKDRHVNSMGFFLNNFKSKEKEGLFAINLSVSSNRDRIGLIETAKTKWSSFCKHIENIPFVNSYIQHSHIEGKIRIDVTNPECYNILSKYKFILSPPGAGIDCHRTWELLYCNTIPIIISSHIDEIYRDLPVVIVSSWDEISEEFLNSKYEEIRLGFENNIYNMKKLEMSYWIDIICNKKDECKDTKVFKEVIDEQKIHFMTYGNDKFKNSRERLTKEAKDFGVFETIKCYTHNDIPDDFKTKYMDVLSMERGDGYWIWRPILLLDMINKTKENDIIVYLDAGCTLNSSGKSRFYEYINMLNSSKNNYGILSFQMSGVVGSGKLEAEYRWTCKEIFDYYNIDPKSNIRNSGQYLGGILVMKNNKHLKEVINNVLNALDYDRYMFTDKYNSNQHKEFNENRHEQSVFSIQRKINGSVVLNGDESWVLPFGSEESLKYPFWATRIRN